MTARTGKFLPVGMRFACVYELDANGRPKATTTAAYTGLRWSGALAFDIQTPQARVLPHRGGDRVLRTAVLPSLETASGTLRVSDYRFDILAVLSGITAGTVGEAKEFPHYHSQQGYEPVVGLMFYQQSQDLDTGALTWHSYIIPRARCVLQPGSMNENVGELTFQIVPTPTTQRLWGNTLVKATDGYVDAGIFEYDTEGKPAVVGFLGDGTEDEFTFPTGEEALSTDKIAVFENGVLVDSGITEALTGVTYDTAPALNDMITVFYEIENTDVEVSV